MDPEVALAAARAHAKAAERCPEEDTNGALAELATALGHYQALDEWLTKGGFPPEAWERCPYDCDTCHN